MFVVVFVMETIRISDGDGFCVLFFQQEYCVLKTGVQNEEVLVNEKI